MQDITTNELSSVEGGKECWGVLFGSYDTKYALCLGVTLP